MTRPHRIATTASAAALLLALSACAPTPDSPSASSPEETGGFPRTVDVPAGEGVEAAQLQLEEAPDRIAALGYETAEVLAEMGLADRVVLIPEAVLNPALGDHERELAGVESTFPVEMELDAETVLSLQPDLVVMSPRHGAEQKMSAVFEQAGIPTLTVPNRWATPEQLSENIELIGEAVGEEESAEGLAGEIRDGLSPHDAPAAGQSERPRVLVLSNQAGRPFVTAGSAFPLELLDLAGADDVSDELGITTTGPISAEQIIEADPDGILLIDMNGSGERLFAELLGTPAVAALPGAEQTLLVSGGDVQALGLTRTVDGLDMLAEWTASLG